MKRQDNDLRPAGKGGETYPFSAAVPMDENGHAIYENGESWRGYRVTRRIALGFVDGTVGYLGNYIWNDLNQDGIQDLLEPGIEGVKVTAEQYWWNPEGGSSGRGCWEASPNWTWRTQVTNQAGHYVFKSLPISVVDPLNTAPDLYVDDRPKFLAGYRLRIDRSDAAALPQTWSFTYRDNAAGASGDYLDSDASTRTQMAQNPAYALEPIRSLRLQCRCTT